MCIIYLGSSSTIIDRLNGIKNKFLNLCEYRYGIKPNLKSLTDRRRFNKKEFIFKLLNGSIDNLTFKNDFHRTNYGYASPLDRTFRLINNMHDSDIFFNLLSHFKYIV